MKQKVHTSFSSRTVHYPQLLVILAGIALVCLPAFPAEANGPAVAGREQPRQPHASAAPGKEQPRQAYTLTPPKEQPRTAPAPRVNPVASELESVSTSAEEIFELASAGRVDRIGKKLEGLKRTAASLPIVQDDSNSMLLSRLKHTVTELDQALAAKDRLEMMRYANRITLIAATVAVQFRPGVPTEVSLLDYNARELGIWSETRRNEKLANIVMRMHLTWQTLMPKLVDRNATKELKRFSEVMGRLEVAKTPEEYGRLSRQVTSELGSIKALFVRPVK